MESDVGLLAAERARYEWLDPRGADPARLSPAMRSTWPQAAAALALLWLAACAAPAGQPSDPQSATGSLAITDTAAAALAPSGALRVGVYLGSPISLVRGGDGLDRGVSVALGQALVRPAIPGRAPRPGAQALAGLALREAMMPS